jgi:hypothetical protein
MLLTVLDDDDDGSGDGDGVDDEEGGGGTREEDAEKGLLFERSVEGSIAEVNRGGATHVIFSSSPPLVLNKYRSFH